eukprot:Gb_35050 [translate_table: standard]
MADAGSHKHLLALIHDYANEKSQGERHLEELRRRYLELTPELAAATALLEATKSRRELAEQDLKGLEVELTSTEATVQARQVRIHSQQDEIAKARSKLEGLENEEAISREKFINTMLELNRKIRDIQEYHKEANMQSLLKEKCGELSYLKGLQVMYQPDKEEENQETFGDLDVKIQECEEKLAFVTGQIHEKRDENEELQRIHKEITEEYRNLERKMVLMETVLEESKELQSLSRDLEAFYTSLSDQLQKLYTCPKCGVNNIEQFGAAE